MSLLTDDRRAILRAVCDTVIPAIERTPDPDGFWARKASDLGVDVAAAQLLDGLTPEQQAGFAELLDGLAMQGFSMVSPESREQLLRNVALLGPAAAAGVGTLQSIALFLFYGLPDASGHNPNWATFGYPGPVSAPPTGTKTIVPHVPAGEAETLEADVVVVGSGAGGGVIAGTLAQAGMSVVVVEAGPYLDESDFLQLEIPAYQQMYWRGGPTSTADLNVSVQAGATLGGGTTINWTNCLRTTDWVREEWASHGLEGLDTSDFDRHLDTVLARVGATEDCSDPNGPTERMREGAEALGWSFRRCARNTDPGSYSPETAGYMGFGDQSGSKRGTLKTYLQDAFDAGARILVGTTAHRVLLEGGRGAGIEATWTDPAGGRTCAVTVRAARVVVAAGALESPALLLRSGIGGPAVGDHLRLHPCTAMLGLYGTDQRAWWGAPHTGLIDEFRAVEDGYGFLMEGVQYTTALGASGVPWTSGREHKENLASFRNGASFIGLLRDRGHGRVFVDAAGQSMPTYALTDELDVRNTRRAMAALARLHEAAGAVRITGLAAGAPTWNRGDDLGAFIERLSRIPLRAGGARLFSAHQMGTCRMGTDPATSVAGPWGELHDTPGVWIGDASAFPTASGTNPMISIMALAHRTAEAIAQSREPAATAAELNHY
jgi:choline dehydrogenase-like flavoprotein